jgi:hypothetical protein
MENQSSKRIKVEEDVLWLRRGRPTDLTDISDIRNSRVGLGPAAAQSNIPDPHRHRPDRQEIQHLSSMNNVSALFATSSNS